MSLNTPPSMKRNSSKAHQKSKESMPVSISKDKNNTEMKNEVQAIQKLVSNLKEIFESDSRSHPMILGSLRHNNSNFTHQFHSNYSNTTTTTAPTITSTSTVNSHIRGNQRKYHSTNSRWYIYFSNHVIPLLPKEAKNWEKARLHVMQSKQNKTVCIFQRWSILALENLPHKKRIRKRVEEMYVQYVQLWQHLILQRWCAMALGPSSRKRVLIKRRKNMEIARLTLEKRIQTDSKSNLSNANVPEGSVGILSNQMIQVEMHKHVIHQMTMTRNKNILLKTCKAWINSTNEAKHMLDLATNHYTTTTLHKIMREWCKWSFLVSIGLDYVVWKDKPPRQRKIRFDQIQVDYFAERRVIKNAFQGWKHVTKVYFNAKRMQVKTLTVFVRKYLLEWVRVSKRNRQLMLTAYEVWKQHGIRKLRAAFYPWQKWIHQKKQMRDDQQRLLNSFFRCKHRKIIWNIFRRWRHQARYGRIGALYSRNDLMMSLIAQKDHCRKMEKHMNDCIDYVSDMAECLEKNNKLIVNLTGIIQTKESDIVKSKSSIHNAEQELVRLQSIVDCVAKIYPSLTKHIIKMQSNFGFRERGLETYVKMRAQTYNDTVNDDILDDETLQRMNQLMTKSDLK